MDAKPNTVARTSPRDLLVRSLANRISDSLITRFDELLDKQTEIFVEEALACAGPVNVTDREDIREDIEAAVCDRLEHRLGVFVSEVTNRVIDRL